MQVVTQLGLHRSLLSIGEFLGSTDNSEFDGLSSVTTLDLSALQTAAWGSSFAS